MKRSFSAILTLAGYSLPVIGLVLLGVYFDQQASVTRSGLEAVFYVSGIAGLLLGAIHPLRHLSHPLLRLVFVVIVVLVWRISFFPVMVLAGFVSGYFEALFVSIGLYQVYPVFLLAIGAMNFVAVYLAGSVLWLLFAFVRHGDYRQYKTRGVAAAIALPLLLIALAVSFSHPSDWHAIADTRAIDEKPLPAPSTPVMNPYWTALAEPGISLRQAVLFRAAAVTYDLVPEGTRWSQVVKGTLEKEFINTREVSTAFCTKIHYRAFIVAQPFIRDRDAFAGLRD